MQCPRCGYVLYNLTEPRCPECTERFDVTRYTFEPGAVRFACPACGELYEGDGKQGLPAEWEFACRSCGEHVSVASMRVVPDPDLDVVPEATGVGLPWELRDEPRIIRRYWQTCMLGFRSPDQYFRSIRHPGDPWPAMVFGLISLAIHWVGLMGTRLQLMALGVAGPMERPVLPLKLDDLPFVLVGLPFLLLVFALGLTVYYVAVGLLVHPLVLMMVPKEGRRNFAVTVVVGAYATYPAVISVVPVVGGLLAAFWWVYIVAKGVAHLHRTTLSRGLMCCVGLTVYVGVALTVWIIDLLP